MYAGIVGLSGSCVRRSAIGLVGYCLGGNEHGAEDHGGDHSDEDDDEEGSRECECNGRWRVVVAAQRCIETDATRLGYGLSTRLIVEDSVGR